MISRSNIGITSNTLIIGGNSTNQGDIYHIPPGALGNSAITAYFQDDVKAFKLSLTKDGSLTRIGGSVGLVPELGDGRFNSFGTMLIKKIHVCSWRIVYLHFVLDGNKDFIVGNRETVRTDDGPFDIHFDVGDNEYSSDGLEVFLTGIMVGGNGQDWGCISQLQFTLAR